ncbi:MAG: restriction endonuclease [Armatimonadetes bacterium]|nr:restriction endonuclease [Armatimonadota bacterium]
MEVSPISSSVAALPLGALEILVQTLLAREGFGEVEIMNRWNPKQKTKKGGFELVCFRGTGPLRETTLVKVIQDDIRVRMLAELVGNVDRINADFGIVVTTKRACHSARRELPKFTTCQVRIVEPPDIENLMRKHLVGFREHGEPNHAYFSFLMEQAEALEGISVPTPEYVKRLRL